MRFHETNKMARRLEVGGWNYLTSHGMEEGRVLRGEEKSLFSFEKSLFGARSERVLRGEEIGEVNGGFG